MYKKLYIAESGRPGPVLIDIPKDIQNENVTSFYNEVIEIPGYKLEPMPDSMKIREVAKEISKAKRPLLYIGGGVIHSGGSDKLIKFARENRIPVVSTLMGLGAYPPGDSLF